MNSDPGILIVDGDSGRRRALHRDLLASGFNVADSEYPEAAIALARVLRVDLVILHIPAQDNGSRTCREVRAGIPNAALVVLTPCDDPGRIAEILDAGADQCLSGPYHLPEFLAHIRATVRRRGSPEGSLDAITIGEITLAPRRRRAYRSGVEVRLTPKQFDLLHLLMSHPGMPIPHSSLLRTGWGTADLGRIEYLRIFMRQLRAKLNDHMDPRYILTHNRIGYRFAEPDQFLLPAWHVVQAGAHAAR